MKSMITKLAFVAVLAGSATAVSASQLTFTFISPTFGGSGLNGTYLLGTAQAQGVGPKSGAASQQPNLSGLANALSGLGSSIANPAAVNTGVPASP